MLRVAAVVLAAATFASADLEGDLVDDACEAEGCELSLRQLRARRSDASSGPWGITGSERCCLCSSGLATWSKDGQCGQCHDEVLKTAAVSEMCQQQHADFQGASACEHECKSKLEMKKAAWLQQSEEEEAVAEEGDQEVVKMSENWGSSTTEKCCKCKSGSVGWSASGRCSFCHGSVSNTASVAPECTKKSPKFMGNSMCAKACRSKVESSSWSWMQEQSEEEEEAVAEEGDQEVVKMTKNLVSNATNATKFVNTTEQCCKCKSGSFGWSKAGTCSFCKGFIANSGPVDSECTANSTEFLGKSKCAKACKAKLQTGWSWLQQQSEEEEAVAEEGDQEVVKMSENWGSSTTEKCCKCKSGSIGWSSSGRCSFCHGSVSKTASVAAECTKKSPKFMGNSMCAKACRNQVESSWSWLQQLLAEEEEAVAEESDKEVVKMSENWGSSTTEKCCKCKSGSVGWSSSGRCSFCHGSVSKTSSVAAECTKKSPKFMGNSMCAKACRSKVDSSSWSWMQEQSEDRRGASLHQADSVGRISPHEA